MQETHEGEYMTKLTLINNSRQLLLVNSLFQIGLCKYGENKGKFKVRDLKEIREQGFEGTLPGGETIGSRYFNTLN